MAKARPRQPRISPRETSVEHPASPAGAPLNDWPAANGKKATPCAPVWCKPLLCDALFDTIGSCTETDEHAPDCAVKEAEIPKFETIPPQEGSSDACQATSHDMFSDTL